MQLGHFIGMLEELPNREMVKDCVGMQSGDVFQTCPVFTHHALSLDSDSAQVFKMD